MQECLGCWRKKKKDFCAQKRLLFPSSPPEKEAKFMVERSGDSGKWIDCQLMFYRHINSSLKTDISLHYYNEALFTTVSY